MSGINPPQIALKTQAKPAATTRKTPLSYIVRKGDTLSKIAARFKVSVESLKVWNQLSSTRLSVGKKLVVSEPVSRTAAATSAPVSRTAAATPAPVSRTLAGGPAARQVVHKVRPGDTLRSIATAYKTSVDAILSWNKTNDLSVIHPGDQITIFPGESR